MMMSPGITQIRRQNAILLTVRRPARMRFTRPRSTQWLCAGSKRFWKTMREQFPVRAQFDSFEQNGESLRLG
jgi:hypothetical protein